MRKLRQRQTRHHDLTIPRVLAEASEIARLGRMITRLTRDRTRPLHVLRFEDLVRDTAGTMRRVADFLGIAYDDVLLTPSLDNRPWYGDSSFDAMPEGVSARALDPARICLSDEEIDLVADCLGGFMVRFGYTSTGVIEWPGLAVEGIVDEDRRRAIAGG